MRAGRPSLHVALLVAILALGVGLRLAEAWDGRAPVFDAAAYAEIAANLERGAGFTLGPGATQPASNYSPGLPLLVAGVYELSGGVDERLARLLLALIGALAIPLTYLLGRRLGGPGAGLVGAAAVAVYPALVEYHGMFMTETIAPTLLIGGIVSMLWARDPAGSAGGPAGGWRWLIPGVLLGALVLVRPEYLAVSLLLALVALGWEWRDDRTRALLGAGLLLVGAAVVVAPWTVRNAVALDRFVPVSTGGGQVLFAGTYLPSNGDPERVGAEVLERNPGLRGQLPPDPRLEQILAALAAERLPGVETDRALARLGREQLREAIRDEPARWLGFEARKLWNLWGHGPRAVMREPGWAALHWALLLAAAGGAAVLAARRRPELVPVLVVIGAVTAISAVLVASPRRALVLLPLLAALAGVGATAAADSLARRWRP